MGKGKLQGLSITGFLDLMKLDRMISAITRTSTHSLLIVSPHDELSVYATSCQSIQRASTSIRTTRPVMVNKVKAFDLQDFGQLGQDAVALGRTSERMIHCWIGAYLLLKDLSAHTGQPI